MHATEVIGYAIDGAFYCADHAQIDEGDESDGYASPVFAGDEGADDHPCSTCLADEIAERNAKRAKSRAVSPLGPRWEDIGSDVNWLEYGGLWARRVSGNEWHVIAFHNDGESDERPRYAVTLSEVRLNDDCLPSAMSSCGPDATNNGDPLDWSDEYGDPIPAQAFVQALHSYGARRELGSYQGSNAHKLLRAARRAS